MLIDEVTIEVSSGAGGDGAVSFRREKFAPKGGPDGGSGGSGGNVYFESTNNLTTLLHLRSSKKLKAENGEQGKPKNMRGKTGEDIVIKVPLGTLIRDAETDKLIVDLDSPKKILLLQGGRGGLGNSNFKSSVRKAPYIATKGGKSQTISLKLELKLLADVSLVGLPNAGKSTLINVISSAKSKVGAYPFTTLSPKLGVVAHKSTNFVVADVPGLIEDASKGRGLGDRFLKHIERSRIILHMIDLTSDDLIRDYETINRELESYSELLLKKKKLVLGTKIDLETADIEPFKNYIKEKGLEYMEISSHSNIGLEALLSKLVEELSITPLESTVEEITTIDMILNSEDRSEDISIIKKEDTFIIEGRIIESFMDKYVFNEDTFNMMIDILRKEGLNKKLKKAGASSGDTVSLLDRKFKFVE